MEETMSIKNEDLKKIYNLLKDIKNPKIIFCSNYEAMKEDAITEMIRNASQAMHALELYDVEEL